MHRTGADESGPWCWTFPSGGCEDGETLEKCARRELKEEAGLDLEIVPVVVPSGYPVFVAEAVDSVVVLDPAENEHDRFVWVLEDEACARLLPSRVADALRAVARGLSLP